MTEIENAIQALREACPYGHPRFVELLADAAKLHSDKNHDYAAGGSPLGNFERVATILSLYPHLPLNNRTMVMILYMMKQFDAVMWSFSQNIEPKVEGRVSRLKDLFVYAGMAICSEEDETNLWK